jgi:hypothetical protein
MKKKPRQAEELKQVEQSLAVGWLGALALLAATAVCVYLRRHASAELSAAIITAMLSIPVVSVVRRLRPRTAPPQYAMGVWVLLIMVYLCVVVVWSQPQRVTPENAEATIHGWLDQYGLGTRKVLESEIPNAVFALEVAMRDTQQHILVWRPRGKDLGRYIQLETATTLSPDTLAALRGLSEDQRERLILEMQAEMIRTRDVFTCPLSGEPGKMVVRVVVPITEGLTEDVFVGLLSRVDGDTTLAKNCLILRLKEFGRQNANSSTQGQRDATGRGR